MALMRRARGARSDFFPGFADIAEIGIGSLATVYRAREVGTNRLVALKLLNVRDASPRAIESFERESIALGAVSSHPNIVTLFRSFRAADGRPVLVLELCRGAVSDRTRGLEGLPVAEVVAIGVKIAGALETAHRAGILHRDVKPQNILITEFGEPALADFGVAMLQSSTQTTAGLFDFTTLHAAPELLEGGETSAATDVYELASSLYQLIAGKSAFRAYDGESPASVILRILRDPVQPLLKAHIPTQLSDLLVYAMSKDKDSRPPTAAEFAAELSAVEANEGWPRTQFLIREPNGSAAGLPSITRMPQWRERDVPDVGVPQPLPMNGTPWQPPVEVAPMPFLPPATLPPATLPPVTLPPATVPPVEAWSETSLTTSRGAPPDVLPPAPDAPEITDEQLAVRIDEADPDEDAAADQAPTTPGGAPLPRVEPYRPLPGRRPGPPESAQQYPIPPAFAENAEAAPAAVPTWSVRAPSPTPSTAPAPALVADLTLDPLSLRRRATIRSGASAMTVDEVRLALRTWWRRSEIPWSEVQSFEPRFDGGNRPGPSGRLVALTQHGPVELPATKRPLSDLRYLHALLDAYGQRAQLMADR